jgi:hypothetical protein
MKAKRPSEVLEARLQEHTSIAAVTSSIPSASIPNIAPPSDGINPSKNSENRDCEIRELAYQTLPRTGSG